MKKRSVIPILGEMMKKIAPRIGATVLIEPEWGIVSQITFKNGKRKYSRYNSIDLNSLGASEISRDKGYANFFMKKMGYKTIEGDTFYSDKWARTIGSRKNIDVGYKYAKKLGFPVIVKPNSGSQGSDVALVHNKEEFYKALNRIYKNDKIAIVERYMKGNDYRLVVLDDKVISAYRRIPLSVIGDGKSSIRELFNEKKKLFIKLKRDMKIKSTDFRLCDKIQRGGYKWNFVLERGVKIFLLDNANLSTGGESIDVTKKVHPLFKKIAVDLTADMGLRLCGVDLIVNGEISDKPKEYSIIEVNSAPGLDHYVKTGKAQQRIVENLYLEVLKKMSK